MLQELIVEIEIMSFSRDFLSGTIYFLTYCDIKFQQLLTLKFFYALIFFLTKCDNDSILNFPSPTFVYIFDF